VQARVETRFVGVVKLEEIVGTGGDQLRSKEHGVDCAPGVDGTLGCRR